MENRKLGKVGLFWRDLSRGKKLALKSAGVLFSLEVLGSTYIGLFTGSTNLTKAIENPPRIVRRVDDAIADRFIDKYKLAIKSASKNYGIPPELVAATIKLENVNRPRYEDWFDNIGNTVGMDVSLGVGQMRLSTAQGLNNCHYWDNRVVVAQLRAPENAFYCMAELYAANLSPRVVDADSILMRPSIVADLAAKYNAGGHHRSIEATMYGLSVVKYMTEQDTFKPFGRDPAQVKEIMRLSNDHLCDALRGDTIRRSDYTSHIGELL